MKKILLFFTCLFIIGHAFAQSVSIDWAQRTGGASYDRGDQLLIDSQGNVYTFGFFNGTVDFDPSAAVFNLTSAGSVGFFIQKLNNAGNFIWAKTFGGAATSNRMTDVEFDNQGNIIITGLFRDSIDVDLSTATDFRLSNGAEDFFILKINPSGTTLWAQTLGSTTVDLVNAIVVQSTNDIVLTGYFSSIIDFDPGVGTIFRTPIYADMFVLSLNASGNYNWVKTYPGTNTGSRALPVCMALDNADNILISGNFTDTVDFDPGPTNTNTVALDNNFNGNSDAYILKLNSVGDFIWVKTFHSTSFIKPSPNGIVINNVGEMYVGGNFDDSCDFDPGPNAFYYTNPVAAMFILKLNTNGNFIWAKRIGGTSGGQLPDIPYEISLDAAGDLVIAGGLSGIEDFDPNAGVHILGQSAWGSSGDIFIMKLTSLGNFAWAKAMGTMFPESAQAVKLDQLGNIFVTGAFSNTIDIDPNLTILNLISAGSADMFLIKFKNCNETSAVDMITSCTPITWIDGQSYSISISGPKDTIANTNGCDSIITLNLTIVNIDTTVVTSSSSLTSNTSGASYQWLNCNDNYLPIAGAAAQSYTPTTGGNYAVAITINGCTDTSACHMFTPLGIKNQNLQFGFTLYPNPSHEKIFIRTGTIGTFKLYNTLGQLIVEETISKQLNTIELPKSANGLYYYIFNGALVKVNGTILIEL